MLCICMNKQKTMNRQIATWNFLFENPEVQDPFPQVKSAEHMAKINTKIMCLRSGAFPNFSWKLYQKYMKRLWNIYKYINFLSITYFP